MASTGHINVDRSQPNDIVYPDGSENFGYGPMFQDSASSSQGFNQNWVLDPSLTSAGQPHPSALSTPWSHHRQSPQPQHQQRHQASSSAPSYDANSNFYAAAAFNNPSSAFQSPALNFNNHAPFQPYADAALDPSLAPSSASHQNGPFRPSAQFYPSSIQSTIAPAALQNSVSQSKSPAPVPKNESVRSIPPGYVYVGSQLQPAPAFAVSLPKGSANGRFVTIDQDELAKATASTKLGSFVNVGIEAQEFNTSKIGNIPAFIPRRSRNDFKKAAAGNPKLLSKLSKNQAKVVKTKAPKIPRPRLPLLRAESQASTSSSVESSSSEDESDYSDSDDELEIVETPPLPATRPSEPLKATSYDTIKAVWLPRKAWPSSDQIRKGLKDVWEVLSTLRDRWRSDGEALKAATEKKKEKELPMLKERVKSQRDMLEVALSAALEHGHPEVLKLMGENKPFLQMCNIFLVDRAREADFDSRLPRHLLELLVQCTTVTTELLDHYKLKKSLSVFAKRGNETTKSLVSKIEQNANAATKTQAEKTKEMKKEPSPDSKVKEVKPRVESPAAAKTSTPDSVVAGVKRPRPAEGTGTQPAKRVASAATAKPSSAALKRSPAAPEKTAASSNGATTKPKAAGPTKSPGLFAGLQSASKRPGTSNVALVGGKKTSTAGADKKAVAPPAPMAAKPTSSFNFSDYMADLNKPKEPEPSKKDKEDSRPPETEAEKAKRLRREARRHLRVSFKEGPALVDVRLFQHDPEEETGHDASMVRDVGDVGLEGRMFKQHKDQMDIDDEEEDAKLVDFKPPSLIDFSSMPVEARIGENSNFAKFGGSRLPDSPEKATQEKHESSTLLVYYSHSSEIPPCPREPADPYAGDTSMESTEFGTPNELVLARSKELQPHQAAPNGQASGTPDVAALLKAIGAMQPEPQRQEQPAQQPIQTSDPLAALQAFMPSQNQKPASLSQTPQPQPQPQSSTGSDLASVLASLSAHATSTPAQQQQPQQVQAPQAPSMPQMPGMAPGQMPDLQQMMAMFAQAGGMPQMAPGFAQQPMQQQQGSVGGNAAAAGMYENPERKRMREAGDEQEEQRSQKWGGGGKKKWVGERPKYVKACKFWQEGRCLKGADCTFLHE